jgi:hypothetical protein
MKTNAGTYERLEGEFEDTALTAALDRRPAVSIPADFAARVMGRLPEAPRHRKQSRAGSRVGYISVGLVAGVLLLLVGENPAAFSAGKGFAFVFEMMLLAELMAVGCWLGTRRDA